MKVIIIGKGHGWQDAPLEGECWGITQLILRRHVTRVIDLNDYTLWGPDEARDARWARQEAARNGVPYIDRDNYPLKEIIEYFGTDYFSNTVDYAIALALYEGFTEIDLYGVNLSCLSEYIYLKAGVEYWIGRAQGMGAKVRAYGESSVLKTKDGKLYGYGTKQRKADGTLRELGTPVSLW